MASRINHGTHRCCERTDVVAKVAGGGMHAVSKRWRWWGISDGGGKIVYLYIDDDVGKRLLRSGR